jgi:hypothetical protein
MSNPHISENFSDVLDPRFERIWDARWPTHESGLDLYTKVTSNGRDVMTFSEVGAFGEIPDFEGQVTYLERSQGYDTSMTSIEKAGGFQVGRKLFDDGQFHIFDQRSGQLSDSVWRTREIDAARMFNTAFSVDTKFYVNSEGVALCSDSHTTTSGASTSSGFDNKGTTAFSAVALTAAVKQMDKFLGDQGQILRVDPSLILHGTNIYDQVWEVIHSQGKPDSAENGQFKSRKWNYLNTNPNDWFLIDEGLMKQFLIWSDRISPEWGSVEDFETFIWKVRIYMRYAMCWTNWRWIFGSEVG